jgi:hypothetical protein
MKSLFQLSTEIQRVSIWKRFYLLMYLEGEGGESLAIVIMILSSLKDSSYAVDIILLRNDLSDHKQSTQSNTFK